jgi:hypothetical protein
LQADRKGAGVYWTLNRIDPELKARAQDRLQPYAKHTTTDANILVRRNLLIDIDATRPAGISSTDAEHKAALDVAEKIRQELTREGWTKPLLQDSGNGAYLIFRLPDLPNDDLSRDLVKRCLGALARRFNTELAHIDQGTFNASRIAKIPGTTACKGDDTARRPHRLSLLRDVPDVAEPVRIELIQRLAAAVPFIAPQASARKKRHHHATRFAIDHWLRQSGLRNVGQPVSYNGGRKWIVQCPFNPEHFGTSAAVFEGPDGKFGFKCLHQSCADNDWKALRKLLEPGYCDLRRICCNGRQLPAISDEALEALHAANDPPTLFARGGAMVAVISDDLLPGGAMSEADVIRKVFRMSAVERKSCRVIAARLNDLRIPCAYTRDDRLVSRGKRKQRTSGMWRAGRVRGLITNKTYMGTHEYGKRTKNGRPAVARPVPAIVTEKAWEKAQANLKAHMLFSVRGAKNEYLLRGLIKCGLCGLTYIGTASNRDDRPGANREFYYRCNGAHSPSVYLTPDRKCQAKAIRGDELEQQVWSDIEMFLRNPGPVLQQLHSRLESDAKGTEKTRQQITRLESLLAKKAEERNRVVGLFRRGRLDDKALDQQMDEIGKEEISLELQLEELRSKVTSTESIAATVSSAEALLAKLRKRLDGPVSWEMKRNLVETSSLASASPQ